MRIEKLDEGDGALYRGRVIKVIDQARTRLLGIFRPSSGGGGRLVPIDNTQAGRELMLALDLSGSMSEPDMQLGGRPVDRLTAAKAVLADFLDRRAGDRVGLLVFGRRAYVLTPLTRE